MIEQNYCLDCGKPCTGLRCAKDHGLYLFKQTLRETAADDAELLRLRDEEKISFNRLGIRYGVSRTRARQKVINARRREEARRSLNLPAA